MDIQNVTNRIDSNSKPLKKGNAEAARNSNENQSFDKVLKQHQKLEFSGHALNRLKTRSISMDKHDLERLEDAVARAAEKGGRDSLVMDGSRAFLVNIPNKKVVTAVDMMELRDKVFTNIDSTVLTKRI